MLAKGHREMPLFMCLNMAGTNMKTHLFLGLLACSEVIMAGDLKATINTTTHDDYLNVIPSVENTGEAPLQQGKYRLAIHKQSSAGTSTSQQSGTFDLEAGTQQHLSQSRFNISDGDLYQLNLSIWHNDQLILETEKTLP
jgi:hypothetical protein